MSASSSSTSAFTLFAWCVAAGMLAVRSQIVASVPQTIAPPGAAAGAEFYLKRAEEFSGARQRIRRAGSRV